MHERLRSYRSALPRLHIRFSTERNFILAAFPPGIEIEMGQDE